MKSLITFTYIQPRYELTYTNFHDKFNIQIHFLIFGTNDMKEINFTNEIL